MAIISEPEIAAEAETLNDSLPDSGATSKPKRKPKKKSFAAKISHQALMLIRRVHLYSGIFMFPFVLLYGFSGWFFNHPSYFREGTATAFTADVGTGTLADLPSAADVAKDVVEGMNLESFLIDGPEIELPANANARFTGYYSYTVNTDEANHTITVSPVNGRGEVKSLPVETDSEPVDPPAENPLTGIHSVDLQNNPLDLARAEVPSLLDDLELSSGEAFNGRRSPSVVFNVVADGVPCVVTYNLGSGSVSSLREDGRAELAFSDQLKRMHMARMYTPQFDVRWFWALVVDAMFLSMVFWGVSGLFMWWQVKRTRMLGGGVLLASIVFSLYMFVGMHSNLTEGSGRRGGGGARGGSRPTGPPAAQVGATDVRSLSQASTTR